MYCILANGTEMGCFPHKKQLETRSENRHHNAENREKETKRHEKEDQQVATIAETGENLVLLDATINKLNKDELNRQLDYHREEEKSFPNLSMPRPPQGTRRETVHTKKMEDRIREAVSRYIEQVGGVFEVAEPPD